MIKHVPRAALALAVTALSPATVGGSAHAATTPPGYMCTFLAWDSAQKWLGTDDCAPTNGAPGNGPIQGPFTITSNAPAGTAECVPPAASAASGIAETPDRVTGYHCRRT
ncbi:hypothetical protein AB0J52_06370 [Spirillospora sp. NPDC049652]